MDGANSVVPDLIEMLEFRPYRRPRLLSALTDCYRLALLFVRNVDLVVQSSPYGAIRKVWGNLTEHSADHHYLFD